MVSTRLDDTYSDYFTFHIAQSARVKIDLKSVTDSYRFLLNSPYAGGDANLAHNDDWGGTRNAHIETDLAPGFYTVEATTYYPNRINPYTLTIHEVCPPTGSRDGASGQGGGVSGQSSHCGTTTGGLPSVSLTPDPGTVTFNSDGIWTAFDLSTNLPVKVIANPTGTPRVEITKNARAGNHCPPEAIDDYDFSGNGTLYLEGCLAGAGVVEIRRLSDNSLIRTYDVTVRAPVTNPTWDASISPSPTATDFLNDGSWHTFTISSGGDVRVAIGSSSTSRAKVTTNASAGNLCSTSGNSSVTASDGDTVYIAGCQAGFATVEIRRDVDNSFVRSYSISVRRPVVSNVCEPPTSFATSRTSGSSARVTWTNPSGGLTATGRQVNILKYVAGAWVFERDIDEPASGTSLWHLGIDANYSYAYRGRSRCGSGYSTYTAWSVESVYSGGASGADDTEISPTPTPTPSGAQGASDGPPSKDVDEKPPSP